MKSLFFFLTLLLSTMAANAADTVFVSLLTNSDTTVRMTSSGSSAYGPAAKKIVVSGLSATDTLRLVRWDTPSDQTNEAVEVFGLTTEGWVWLSLEGDLPNGDTLVASFAGYQAYLVRHIGGPGPGSQWVKVARVQPAAAFPVEWLGFSATPTAAGVQLSWATAQELNSERFEVERSTDGRGWRTIGRVTAAGWSDSRSDYVFTDESMADRAAYRLRQVDFDGAIDYSNVVEVTINPDADLRISSSLAGTGCYVHGLDERATMRVSTLNGVLVSKSTVTGAGAIQLDVPAGIYVVTLATGSGGYATGKVIIGR